MIEYLNDEALDFTLIPVDKPLKEPTELIKLDSSDLSFISILDTTNLGCIKCCFRNNESLCVEVNLKHDCSANNCYFNVG